MRFAQSSYLFLCSDVGGSGPDSITLAVWASSVLGQGWNGAHRPPTPSRQGCCCLSHPEDCPAPSRVFSPPFLTPIIVFFTEATVASHSAFIPFFFLNTVFFFLRFFWMWTILKSLLNLLQYCFCFLFWCFGHETCEILAPQSGIEPTLLA